MREEVYDISGMHCAACSASVEKVTRRLPGVERSDVNLVAERMTIVYDENRVTQEQIIAKVEKAGFGAKLHQEKQEAAPVQTGEDPEEQELRRKKRELIVSAAFSALLLYVSMGQMLPFGLPSLPLPDLFSMHTHPMNFAVLQLLLAIPSARILPGTRKSCPCPTFWRSKRPPTKSSWRPASGKCSTMWARSRTIRATWS